LQKNGLSWSDYRGLNQIKREQLSPQSPINKKAHAEDMPAYAPTDKEREIVETAAGFGLPHDKILPAHCVGAHGQANRCWTLCRRDDATTSRRRFGGQSSRWSETFGHQMLDEHGKPTSPVINYTGRWRKTRTNRCTDTS
jgi:hypothetical protein